MIEIGPQASSLIAGALFCFTVVGLLWIMMHYLTLDHH